MSKKRKNIEIKPRNIIKGEIDETNFRYIQETLESLIYEDQIEEKKIVQIKNQLSDGLSTEFKKEFIVIISLEPTYYIQYRYKNILILSFDKISFFFYKPRQLDIPRILKLENFPEELSEKVIPYYKCLTIAQQYGILETDNEWIGKVCEHIVKYFYHFKSNFINKQSEFETDFITKLRNHMVVVQKDLYWHFILSKKYEHMLTHLPGERMIEMNLDFSSLIPNKFQQPLKLLMFQRKGENPTTLQNISSRKREVVGFIGLFLLFITLIMCKSYVPKDNLDPENPFSIVDKKKVQNNPIQDLVCPQKQIILMGLAVLFLSMVFARIFNRYQQKIKFKQQQQQEREKLFKSQQQQENSQKDSKKKKNQ